MLRLHSGDAGPHVEGSVYTTDPTPARELVAQGIVEITDEPARTPVVKSKAGRSAKAA